MSKVALSVGAPASPECSCEHCRHACERTPPPYLPAQAEAAVNAGLGDRLMLGYVIGRTSSEPNTYFLMPAVAGHEGRRAPNTEEMLQRCHMSQFEARMFPLRVRQGRCVFLTKDRLCALHSTPHKPDTCRQALCCSKTNDRGMLHPLEQAKYWETYEALALIERWKKLVRFDDASLADCY